jgi:iron complex outermembrane receptor protein
MKTTHDTHRGHRAPRAFHLLLALLPLALAAQENKDEIIQLEKFTVSTTIGSYVEQATFAGSKTPMDLKDLPKTVQVLNAALLQDLRAQTLDDIYPYVIGMTREAAVAVGFTLRGFSNSIDDTLNNLQVDGLPGLASRFGSPTTANVERVELIKGPTSVLYGLMQPGGIVNIITKQPLQKRGNTLFASVGTYAGDSGTFGTGASFGNSVNFISQLDSTGPIDAGKHWLYRIIADYEHLEGFQVPMWAHNYSFFPSLTYRLDEKTQVTATVEITRQERFSNSFLAIPFFTPSLHPNFGTVYQDPSSKEYDWGETYGLNFSHRFDNNWVLKVQGRHVEHTDGKLAFENQNVTSVDSLGTVPPIVPTLADVQNSILVRRLRHQKNLRQYTFVDANIYGDFGPESFRNTVLFGLNGGYENSNFLRLAFQRSAPFNVNLYNPVFTVAPFPPDAVTPPSDGITRQYNYGVYLSDQIKLGRNWRLVLSARHDRQDGSYDDRFANPIQHRSRSDQASVPSFGLMYQPTDNVGYYVSYSKSFVPPNATTVDANGSANFVPTVSDQIEVGVKADMIDHKLNATVSLYDIVRNNVAEPIPNGVSPIDGAQTFVVSGQEESEGVEFSVTYQPVKNWQLQTGYTYDDVRITRSIDPTQLNARNSNAPRQQANLWTRYNIPDGGLRGLGFGLGVIYVGNRHGAFSNIPSAWMEIPSYMRVDTALFYQWKHYSFALNISNALDRGYLSYVASNNNVHAGDPRKLTFSLTTPF